MSNMQYIGARYVPVVYVNPDDDSADWKEGVDYESLTIVTYNGDSYTSKKAVPNLVGNPLDNREYWVKTGDFNASLLMLQRKVGALERQNGNETLETDAQTLSGAINELAEQNGNETLETTAQTLSGGVNELKNDFDSFNVVNAVIAGMVADDNTPETKENNRTIFQNLINNYKNIVFPEGRFYFDGGSISVGNQNFIHGAGKLTIDDNVGTCLYGIQLIVTSDAKISDLEVRQSVDADNNPISGIKIRNRCLIERVSVYDAPIGFDMTENIRSFAYVTFIDCLAAYCTDCGYKLIQNNILSQKNVIRFFGCTATSCGTDVNDYDVPATLNSGYGFYIDGGFAITLYNCCSQYNSGTGIFVKGGLSGTVGNGDILSGLIINGSYLESNKYAHIVLDLTDSEGYFGNIDISGSFYIDNDGVLALSNHNPIRGVVIVDGSDLLKSSDLSVNNKWTSHNIAIDGVSFVDMKDYNNADNKLMFRNLNVISKYAAVFDNKEIVNDGLYCLKFDKTNYYTERTDPAYRSYRFDKGHGYKIRFKYKKTAGTSDAKLDVRLYSDSSTNIRINTKTIGTSIMSEFAEYEEFYYPSADYESIILQLFAKDMDDDFELEVGDICVEEVDTAYGSPFPTVSQIGFQFFHTGLNMLYLWDGTHWRKPDGTIYNP